MVARNNATIRTAVVFRRSIAVFSVGRGRVLAVGIVAATGYCSGSAGSHHGILLFLEMFWIFARAGISGIDLQY